MAIRTDLSRSSIIATRWRSVTHQGAMRTSASAIEQSRDDFLMIDARNQRGRAAVGGYHGGVHVSLSRDQRLDDSDLSPRRRMSSATRPFLSRSRINCLTAVRESEKT